MSQSVYKAKTNVVQRLFGRTKAVIGVIHALPLPGSANYDGDPIERIYEHACAEARRYADGGVDGLIVENHGDIPFVKPEELGPETAAVMAVMTDRVARATPLPVGVNVLANGAIQAIAVAKAAGARFVRVNQWANAYVANEGFVEGKAGLAARYRNTLRARDVAVFADVHVKHGAHAIMADRTLTELTRDAQFFDADAVIVTGQRTGDSANLDDLATVQGSTSLPVVVGSGVNPENVGAILGYADAVIVASALKHDGGWWNEVDPERVKAFMAVVREARR
ncbi:BtpA family membrane complex biogenesis protein [Alsobacter soli]|uniref:BtpA family membrane complex biogenesis protein n=1 Tax=Alsobacter soli TaxID=2109933 RepID=A0A2T1HLI2_9HYPH|nr:BtpA/SgcQ family protein [Alsobacter soli]PSC02515.1 BtpA family membrane complex biogenesis protein [Alsobacter soli]